MSYYIDTSVIAAYYCPEPLSSAAAGRKVLAAFQSHVALGYYHRLAITRDHYAVAQERISDLSVPLRTLDALHLAVAMWGDFILVTADRKLASAMEQFGGQHRLVRPSDAE